MASPDTAPAGALPVPGGTTPTPDFDAALGDIAAASGGSRFDSLKKFLKREKAAAGGDPADPDTEPKKSWREGLSDRVKTAREKITGKAQGAKDKVEAGINKVKDGAETLKENLEKFSHTPLGEAIKLTAAEVILEATEPGKKLTKTMLAKATGRLAARWIVNKSKETITNAPKSLMEHKWDIATGAAAGAVLRTALITAGWEAYVAKAVGAGVIAAGRKTWAELETYNKPEGIRARANLIGRIRNLTPEQRKDLLKKSSIAFTLGTGGSIFGMEFVEHTGLADYIQNAFVADPTPFEVPVGSENPPPPTPEAGLTTTQKLATAVGLSPNGEQLPILEPTPTSTPVPPSATPTLAPTQSSIIEAAPSSTPTQSLTGPDRFATLTSLPPETQTPTATATSAPTSTFTPTPAATETLTPPPVQPTSTATPGPTLAPVEAQPTLTGPDKLATQVSLPPTPEQIDDSALSASGDQINPGAVGEKAPESSGSAETGAPAIAEGEGGQAVGETASTETEGQAITGTTGETASGPESSAPSGEAEAKPAEIAQGLDNDNTGPINPNPPPAITDTSGGTIDSEAASTSGSETSEPTNQITEDSEPAEQVSAPPAPAQPPPPPAPEASVAPVSAIEQTINNFPKDVPLPQGSTPWAVAEGLLKEANPNGNYTPADIMAVDRVLCEANGIAVPEWGIEGKILATRLPAGMPLNITDSVKDVLKQTASK